MSETLHTMSTRRCLGLAVAAVLVLAACGPSSNRYLADRDEKVYLRVPSSWHNINLSDSFADRLTQSTTDAKVLSKTVVTPQPNAHEQNDLDGESPFATMTVYQTTGQLNQLLSASLARKIGLVSFDPVLPDDANKDLAEVISFDPRPTNAKIAGSRIVYRTRSDKTMDWQLTVNLSTYFDPSASRLYALEVICSTTCYDKSSGQIDKIVNSWRIG
jgi:hypothetical protein